MLPGNPWIAATAHIAHAEVAADRDIYLAGIAYLTLCAAYVLTRGGLEPIQFWATVLVYCHVWWQGYGLLFPLALAGMGWAHIVLRLSERRRLAFRIMFGPQRVGRLFAGMVLLTLMVPFHTAFNSVKVLIPNGQGFVFDQVLADLDKTLFLGIDPFRLLYWVGEPVWLLRAIEINYNNLWFVICFFMLFWVAVSPRLNSIRLRYFLTFLLCWGLLGNVLATILSSAGPVYFGHVTGDHGRFAGQIAFLSTTMSDPGSAAGYQAYLWEMYRSGHPGLGTGISAFPSMHLALFTMNAMFVRELKPSWAPWAWAYTAILLVSSVYLGWHYAVDGIAAIALAVGLYWVVRGAMSLKPQWRWARGRAAEREDATA